MNCSAAVGQSLTAGDEGAVGWMHFDGIDCIDLLTGPVQTEMFLWRVERREPTYLTSPWRWHLNVKFLEA